MRAVALAPVCVGGEVEAYLTSETGLQLIEKFPMKRLGDMSELDGPLLLLASEAGSFMTGTVIPVDGGALLSMS